MTREQFETRLAAVIEYLYPTFKPHVLASEGMHPTDPFIKEMALRERTNRLGILAVSFLLYLLKFFFLRHLLNESNVLMTICR